MKTIYITFFFFLLVNAGFCATPKEAGEIESVSDNVKQFKKERSWKLKQLKRKVLQFQLLHFR